MHYIRFLKQPSFSQQNNNDVRLQLKAKITITTDLGESFLCSDLPLLVILLDEADNHAQVHPYQWKSGNRQLEILFTVTMGTGQRLRWPCRLLIQSQDLTYHSGVLADMLIAPFQVHPPGGVLPVLSDQIYPHITSDLGSHRVQGEQSSGLVQSEISRRVARRIYLAGGDELYIWEETGESIPRHIWDAGLLLSAILDSFSAPTARLESRCLDRLQTLLSNGKLDVLELGTGCGIVGITLAKRFPKAEVLLTDLPEAEEIARHNMTMIAGQSHRDSSLAKIEYQNLDWAEPLPKNLCNGNLDLVLVADCTYNSDVVPDLVKTLADLVTHNRNLLIVVAMKIRHDSEMVFFELMRKKHMNVVDRIVLPLPLLGQDVEEIEVYLFKG